MSGKAYKQARKAVKAYQGRITQAAEAIKTSPPPLIIRLVGFFWRPLLRKHSARQEIMADAYKRHCMRVMESESKRILHSKKEA